MRLFNDIIDLGELDETTLLVLNVLVILHLVAFVVLIVVVVRNMMMTDQELFVKQVVKMETQAKEQNRKKKNEWHSHAPK